MWPGIDPTPSAMEAVFTTGPPGKSQKHFFFFEWKSSSRLWASLWVKTCSFPWGTLIVSLDSFFLAKGNFSKFPQGQITQEGITLTIQHSKRRGSWGYPWLVCKPLLNPPVFWSSPTLLCLVLWIQGLSLLPPRWTSNGRGRSLAAHIGEEALALQLGILPKVRQLTF